MKGGNLCITTEDIKDMDQHVKITHIQVMVMATVMELPLS